MATERKQITETTTINYVVTMQNVTHGYIYYNTTGDNNVANCFILKPFERVDMPGSSVTVVYTGEHAEVVVELSPQK